MTGFVDVLAGAGIACVFGIVVALVSDWRWHR